MRPEPGVGNRRWIDIHSMHPVEVADIQSIERLRLGFMRRKKCYQEYGPKTEHTPEKII